MNPPHSNIAQDQGHSVHSSFLTAFQHLARGSVSTLRGEWPFIPERTRRTTPEQPVAGESGRVDASWFSG